MKIGQHYLIGTIHWAGIYNKKPAFILSQHGGASLWVYTTKWVLMKDSDNLYNLFKSLGLSDNLDSQMEIRACEHCGSIL